MEKDYRKYYEGMEARKFEINIGHAKNGVEFIDINQAYIGENVQIGSGTIIYPGVIIEGTSKVGKGCKIFQNTRIADSIIGDEVEIQSSVITESRVGDGSTVGPFAYLRPKSNVGKNCKVGDFVEIKNANMGDGSKASHLTYIGDADVGEGVNLGCGVVFVNYDGKNKHRTIVEDGAFIGCNTNLVAPVTVGKKGYTGAGSTVTKDVPDGSLYVERSKDRVIEGWVDRTGLLNKKK